MNPKSGLDHRIQNLTVASLPDSLSLSLLCLPLRDFVLLLHFTLMSLMAEDSGLASAWSNVINVMIMRGTMVIMIDDYAEDGNSHNNDNGNDVTNNNDNDKE